jgi:hypothetical protein
MFQVAGGDVPRFYENQRRRTLWRTQQLAMDRMRRNYPHYKSNILAPAYCSLRIARRLVPS